MYVKVVNLIVKVALNQLYEALQLRCWLMGRVVTVGWCYGLAIVLQAVPSKTAS